MKKTLLITVIVLAILAVAAILGSDRFIPSQQHEIGANDKVHGAAQPLATPAQLMSPDRYEDLSYGFSLDAISGWYNETGPELRKQFSDARGAIVQEDSRGTRFVEIKALPVPADAPPVDHEAFMESLKSALQAGEGSEILDSAIIEVAGSPAVSILSRSPGVYEPHTIWYVFIFGAHVRVDLSLCDMSGTWDRSRPDLEKILATFRWTGEDAAENDR